MVAGRGWRAAPQVFVIAMHTACPHTDPNAMTIDPGETGSMTWRFVEPGDVLYGCHQPGHYDAGMVGVIEVTP